MPYAFLLGFLLLIAAVAAARWFAGADPRRLAQAVRAFAATFGALAGTGLMLNGRVGFAIVAIASTVIALRTLFQNMGDVTSSGGRKTSDVETRTLRMALDHASGEIEGEVVGGPFAGRRLAAMGLSDLLSLLAWCQEEDPPSVALLQTYLDRRDPDWRDKVDGTGGKERAGRRAGDVMDEATALEILGLAPDCRAAEVRAAHRRLMAHMHPDRGGSTFLASQINQARDVLLKTRA
ncbi:DnaJ domain-containing protein [Marinivivus vitaminiproducens]|uniref:DnaJ domain-containing protein n=1 Tax=Marinivivus vitaminiproducens TaxID=3035935 RepID=UPI0027A94CBD|nr:hypothetical protein P4R82_08900 [Geminicoccaceae bacterium SCSIO 64248]